MASKIGRIGEGVSGRKGVPKLPTNKDRNSLTLGQIVIGLIATLIAVTAILLVISPSRRDKEQTIPPQESTQPATTPIGEALTPLKHNWAGESLQMVAPTCLYQFEVINDSGLKELHCEEMLQKGDLIQVTGIPFGFPDQSLNLWPATAIQRGRTGYVSDDAQFRPAVDETYLTKSESCLYDKPGGSCKLDQDGKQMIVRYNWSIVLEQVTTVKGQYWCSIQIIGVGTDGYLLCKAVAVLEQEVRSDSTS